MTLHGLVLAAGAGTRMGRPKGLVRDDAGRPWVAAAVGVLRDGGCEAVTVVVGAAADEVTALVEGAAVVVADDWADGMGASLRRGLLAAADTGADAVVVTLVDLPDLSPAVVRRLVADPPMPDTLRRASYDGEPGHPVVIGRRHWPGVAEAATGDRGARDYLRTHPVDLVECADLASGRDVDTPPAVGP